MSIAPRVFLSHLQYRRKEKYLTMRLFALVNFFFPVFISLTFSNAQATFNPLSNPGCSTVESIVQSCAPKIGADATVSSVAFSCLCYDGSGNYAPTIYGDAATACTNYILSVFSTQGNQFVQYAAGFCTDPNFVPTGTTPVISTPTATGVGVVSTGSAPAQVSYIDVLVVNSTSDFSIDGSNFNTRYSTSRRKYINLKLITDRDWFSFDYVRRAVHNN
jgi:hypothetical protein